MDISTLINSNKFNYKRWYFTINMCINNCCSFRLPLLCRCVAPGPAFTQLTPQQSMIVLYNLTTLCSDLDPQVSTHSATSMVTRIRLAKNIKK